MTRVFRLVAATAFVVAATVGASSPAVATRATAAPPNTSFESVCPGTSARARVAVVIDLGGGDVRASCVEFDGSITGIEALRRADADPVVRGYSDLGGAICALCGVGCPGDGSCLTCAAPKSWGYYRRPAGASAFTYSRTGAGSVNLRDGDVEGWSWGSGLPSPPATTAVPPATAAPGTPAPPGTIGTGTAPAGGSSSTNGAPNGTPGATGVPVPTDPTATTAVEAAADAETTTTLVDGAASTTSPGGEGREIALPAVASGPRAERRSPMIAVVFGGMILVTLVGSAAWLRMRRRRLDGPVDSIDVN